MHRYHQLSHLLPFVLTFGVSMFLVVREKTVTGAWAAELSISQFLPFVLLAKCVVCEFGSEMCRHDTGRDIDDNLKGTKAHYFFFLSVLDSVISSILVGPAVISYWRGTWGLYDVYLLPQSPQWSSLASLIIGLIGNMFFVFTQELFARNFHPEKNRILYYLASRSYSYLFGAVAVSSWRGVWNALDIYSSKDPVLVAGITLAATIALMGTRTLRNISDSPFAIALDLSRGYFEFPTMFKINVSRYRMINLHIISFCHLKAHVYTLC